MRFDIVSWIIALLICWLGKPLVVDAYGSSEHGRADDVSGSDYDYSIGNDGVLQDCKVSSLTTEYLESPLGVDKAAPRVSWKIQSRNEDDETNSFVRRNVFQESYQLQVSSSTTSSVWKGCGWVKSKETNLVPLECEGLTPITTSDMNVSWRVSVRLNDGLVIESDIARFRTGMMDPWRARWINGGRRNAHENDRNLFRKEFFLAKANRTDAWTTDSHHATLFVAGIGYNYVYLNGVKVGDHELDPGFTNFTKRIWYSTYDVTQMLRFGDRENVTSSDVAANNAIAVMLGNGWWSCGPLPGTGQDMCSRDPPQLILQLHVDGQPVLLSDVTWRTSADSPIVYNSLYNGEVYDARIADRISGWKDVHYDDSDWPMAEFAKNKASKAILASQLFEPIRHVSTRTPISSVTVGSGDNLSQVLDFGQNQAAVVRLKHFYCASGSSIRLRHAELLMHPPYGDYDNATLYVDNLRKAKSTDYYICSGNPEGESYTPSFAQHGFRYLEITGLNYTLDPSDIEQVELHTDVKQTSFIQFSEPLLNQIHHMVMWGLKSNFMSIQTDCNQRDERKGWMGDAALTAEAAVLSFGMGAFYTHWLTQMVENQNPGGSMPNIVPPMGKIDTALNWQTAYPMILWNMMTYYGDRLLISNHHDSLVRYFDFLESSYQKTGVRDIKAGYGDWVPPRPQPKADPHFMGAFALLGDIKLGIDIFQFSDHPDSDSQMNRLKELRAKISPEFHNVFYNSTTGVYKSGLQTEQALPLYLDVVPSELQDSVLSTLINDIQIRQEGHTTSGIVGIKYAMEVLSSLDRGDVALDLALQTSYPSWGYMINSQYEPATTVWELWESDTEGPHMNSRNHHMFGSISSWFYKHVAGIQPLDPGFSRVQIRPNLLRLDNFTAKLSAPPGFISLNYQKEDNGDMDKTTEFSYDITLPPCTSGTFHIPIASDDREAALSDEMNVDMFVEESGIPIWQNWKFLPGVDGVQHVEKVGKHLQIEISNGKYKFKVSISKAASVATTML